MAILARSRVRHLAVVFVVLALYLVRAWHGMAGESGRIPEMVRVAAALLAYTVPLVFAGTFRDMAGGVAKMWLQKPIHPVRFYLVRFVEGASVSVAVLIAVIAVCAAAALVGDPSYTVLRAARTLAFAVLITLSIVSVGFGLSAWFPRIGGLATVAFLGLTFATEIQTALAMTSPEPPPVGLARRVLIPLWALRDMGDAIRGTAPFSLAALAWILGYIGTWEVWELWASATRWEARAGGQAGPPASLAGSPASKRDSRGGFPCLGGFRQESSVVVIGQCRGTWQLPTRLHHPSSKRHGTVARG